MVAVLLLSLLAFCSRQSQAQTIASCTVALQNWTTNDEGQSPCQVATSLLNACTPQDQPTSLSPLKSTQFTYTPPPSTSANTCTCSSVAYAMVSACAVCQGSLPGPWSKAGNNSWIANCPANMVSLASFPNPVPQGTFIPVWAFQNVSNTNDVFDAFLAEQLSQQNQPDVTSGVDPLTSTSTGTPTSSLSSPTSSASSNPSSTTTPSTHHKKSDGGVIAGAVIGSLAGVACVSLAICFYVRYRKQRTPRRHFEGNYEKTEPDVSLLNGQSGPVVPAVVQYPPLKLYDPSDPSTFPTAPEPVLTTVSASPTLVGASSPIHSRNNSAEANLLRTPPSHSRQPSSETTSVQSSLNSPVVATPGRNFNSGYNPSGIVYRTIPE